MAYQRVTLADLKARLAERLGGDETFWSEPQREAAINEALSAWQLLTGEFVAVSTVTLADGENYATYTSSDTPAATFLRVRCDETLPVSPTVVSGTVYWLPWMGVTEVAPLADVELLDAEAAAQTTTAGTDGTFSFSGVAAGTATITATYSFVTAEVTVEAVAETTVTTSLTIEEPPN